MRRRLRPLVALATLVVIGGCAGSGAELAIRASSGGIAPGALPPADRVAEARAQLALGNVAFAAEAFRAALRGDPGNVDAMNGLAGCYDRMGRSDLARGFYERALARAPDDLRLYANLAASLDLAGKPAEAAAVRAELARRGAGVGGATIALPATAAIAAAEPVREATSANSPMAEPLPAEARAASLSRRSDGPRLERLNLAEVILVTSRTDREMLTLADREATPPVPATAAPPPAVAKAFRPPVSQGPRILLLNAARADGLAARTRIRLRSDGWGTIHIGNARQALATSELLYPVGNPAEARRLARRLGVTRLTAWREDRLVVRLGRDVLQDRGPRG